MKNHVIDSNNYEIEPNSQNIPPIARQQASR